MRVTSARATSSFDCGGQDSTPRAVTRCTVLRSPPMAPPSAETEHIIAHAKAKLARKGCDWILANDVSAEGGAMGGDRNTVHLVSAQGVESWPPQSKEEVARALVTRIAETLAGAKR